MEYLKVENFPDEVNARDRSPLLADRLGTAHSAVGLWKVVKKATRAAGIEKDGFARLAPPLVWHPGRSGQRKCVPDTGSDGARTDNNFAALHPLGERTRGSRRPPNRPTALSCQARCGDMGIRPRQ